MSDTSAALALFDSWDVDGSSTIELRKLNRVLRRGLDMRGVVESFSDIETTSRRNWSRKSVDGASRVVVHHLPDKIRGIPSTLLSEPVSQAALCSAGWADTSRSACNRTHAKRGCSPGATSSFTSLPRCDVPRLSKDVASGSSGTRERDSASRILPRASSFGAIHATGVHRVRDPVLDKTTRVEPSSRSAATVAIRMARSTGRDIPVKSIPVERTPVEQATTTATGKSACSASFQPCSRITLRSLFVFLVACAAYTPCRMCLLCGDSLILADARVAAIPIRHRQVELQQAVELQDAEDYDPPDGNPSFHRLPGRGPGDGYKAERIFSGDGGRRAHKLHAQATAKAEVAAAAAAIAAGGAVPVIAEAASFFGSCALPAEVHHAHVRSMVASPGDRVRNPTLAFHAISLQPL